MSDAGGTEVGRLYYRLGVDDSELRAALGRSGQTLTQAARGTNALTSAQRELDQVTTRATRSAKDQGSALDDLKKKAASLAAGYGAFQFAKGAFQANMEFDKSVREVFSLIPDASARARDSMINDIESVSVHFGMAGSEAAEGFYEALSAGIPQGKLSGFMDVAAKTSIGGVSDLATSVDALTTATNSYASSNVTAEQASDSLFQAVKFGKTTLNEMAQNLSDVYPIASALGISMDDVNGSIAAMTLQGAPTAQATTYLRNAMTELSKSGMQANANFEKAAGKTFPEFIKQGGNLGEAMQTLSDYAKKSGKNVNEMFSSIEGGLAALMLSGANFRLYQDAMEQMAQKTGATDAAFNEMAKSVDFKWNQSMQRLQVGLREAGNAMTPLILQAAKLAATIGDWAIKHGDAVKVLGSMAVAVYGLNKALSAYKQISKGLAEMRAWQASLAAETGAANAAAAANTRLAGARAIAARVAPAVGIAALAAVGTSAYQGATDKALTDYYKQQGMSGLGAGTASAFAQIGHNLGGFIGLQGVSDKNWGYDTAHNLAAQEAELKDKTAQAKAAVKMYEDAKAAADEMQSSSNGSMAQYQQDYVSAVTGGSAQQVQSAVETLQKVQQQIDSTRQSLSSAVDLFAEADSRYSKVDPAAVKDAQRAFDDAKNTEANALDKVNQVRSSAKSTARDLADAENALADAREKSAQAQEALSKASKPQDQSMDPAKLLANFQAQVQAEVAKAGDVSALGRAGVRGEVIQKLLDVDKNSPGTLHRFVTEGITQPVVDELNKGWGQIDGADNVIADALMNQITSAGKDAADAAYNQGKTAADQFAKGFADGAIGKVIAAQIAAASGLQVGSSGSGGSGQIGSTGGSGSGGSGIVIGQMNISGSPQEWQRQMASQTSRNNLAGGH